MNFQHWVALVGTVITLGSYSFYFRDIFAGRVKPHGFSWFVWGMLTATGFAAQVWGGGGWGSAIMGATALACFSISIVSLRYGEKSITRSDWIAFAVGLSAIPLWIITHSPFWSVVILALADTIGYWPSLRKTWARPHEEGSQVFALASLKQILAVMALTELNWVTGFYPFALIFINAAFVAVILLRRRNLKSVVTF